MIDPREPDYSSTPVGKKRPAFDYRPQTTDAAPQVTIVTPFYNTGQVFQETAESVLRQSFQQWEWLIVNDGSTDTAALSILDTWRRIDPRIRVIDHALNKGLSAARNTGFREARTGYVVQLDSDDLLEPTAVEKWYWFLESHPEFAFCKGYAVSFGSESLLWQRGFHDGSVFLEDNLVDPTSMVRTPVHQAVSGYDETNRGGLEDWDFWLRCASHGYWGSTVPEFLNWYRRRPTHTAEWPNWANKNAFRAGLHARYPRLLESFPDPQSPAVSRTTIALDLPPASNRLTRIRSRILLVTPATISADGTSPEVDLVQRLGEEGWDVSVIATQAEHPSWLAHMTRHTPDVFVLGHFLRAEDYPRFLLYLVQSRQVDVVLVADREFGHLMLPLLRASCPGTALVDVFHSGEWIGCTDLAQADESQALVDFTILSSVAIAERLARNGIEGRSIGTCDGPGDRARCVSTLLREAIAQRKVTSAATAQPTPEPVSVTRATRAAVLSARTQELTSRIATIEQVRTTWQQRAIESERDVTEKQKWIDELQRGKEWLEEQWKAGQTRAADDERDIAAKQAWIDELEKGKTWLEEQVNAWQTRAAESERDRAVKQSWIDELEKGKAWLEEQMKVWQTRSAENERASAEKQSSIDELQEARDSLDRQVSDLTQQRAQLESDVERSQRTARDLGSALESLRGTMWVRLGTRLGLIPRRPD